MLSPTRPRRARRARRCRCASSRTRREEAPSEPGHRRARGRRLTAVPIEPDPDGDPDLRAARARRPTSAAAAARWPVPAARAASTARWSRRRRRGLAVARRPRRRRGPASRTGSPAAARRLRAVQRARRAAARQRPDRGAIILSRRVNAAWPESTHRFLEAAAVRGVGGAGPRLLAARGRGPRDHRRPDRAAEPPLLRRVPRAARRRRRAPRTRSGVLMIDIDRFKKLNDTFGHAAGDHVLREVARRSPRPSARTTSRPGSAARSSRSCCRNPIARGGGRGGRARAARRRHLDLRGMGVRGVRVGGWPWPTSPTGARRADRRGGPRALPREARRPRPGVRRLTRPGRPTPAESRHVPWRRAPPCRAHRHAARGRSRSGARRRPETTRSANGSARPPRNWTPRTFRPPTRIDDELDEDGGRGRGRHQRRARADLPRDRRHPRGQGRVPFKTVAYHRAADAIAGRRSTSARATPRPATTGRSSGVGAAITDKIVELATTGHMVYHERLRAEIPPSLVDLLRIPGSAQDRAHRLGGLGIETLEDLEQAPQERACAASRASRRAPRQRILEGIEKLEIPPPAATDPPRPGPRRRPRRVAPDLPGATRIVQAGSPGGAASRSATSTCSSRPTDPDGHREVHAHGNVDKVVGAGGAKAAVTLHPWPAGRPDGDAARAGGHRYLVHFTGSAAHNIRLRGIARDRGWSLSEKGFVRIGEEGEPLRATPPTSARSRTRPRSTASSSSPTSSPSCARTGEIEAAMEGRLPTSSPGRPPGRPPQPQRLVRRRPLDRGHGRGRAGARLRLPGADRPLAEPGHRPRADARPRRAGARDHRRAQRPVRRRGGRRACPRALIPAASASSTAASWRSAPTATSTTRTTCSPGSTSSSPRSTSPAASREAELTRRTLNAIRSPHVDVIAHPSGRMIQTRDDLDLDWDAVFEAAAARAPRSRSTARRTGWTWRRSGRAVPRRGRLPALDRLRRPPDRGARVRPLGDRPGAPRLGRAAARAQHAAARRPAGLGRGQAVAGQR